MKVEKAKIGYYIKVNTIFVLENTSETRHKLF